MSRIFVGLALVVACGPRASLPASSESQTMPDDELHALFDCPWVVDSCPATALDGCSETEGHATDTAAPIASCGDALPYPALLADARGQLRAKPALSALRVVAPTAACAADVRAALGDAVRVETVVRRTRYVQFEVAAWNGARCR